MGGGKPAALQCNVRFCFSLTVTEGEGFVMKCGNSRKKILSVFKLKLKLFSVLIV